MLTFKNWFLSFTFKQRIIAITIFVLVVSALGYVVLKKQAPSAIDTSSDIRIVQVASVSSLGDSSVPLMLSGDVKSLSEANIKAEASGRVTHVYKKIGDTVLAGEVIAEIEHSRELASLDQAKAALEQAKISQSISDISQGSSDALLKEALNSTINTLRSTYDGVEDIVRNKFDPLFSNPTSESPTFNIVSSNSQLVNDLNSERLKVQSILNEEHERRSKLSTDNDLLTSSTIFPAARDTPSMSCPVIINGSSPPTSNPTMTVTFVKL